MATDLKIYEMYDINSTNELEEFYDEETPIDITPFESDDEYFVAFTRYKNKSSCYYKYKKISTSEIIHGLTNEFNFQGYYIKDVKFNNSEINVRNFSFSYFEGNIDFRDSRFLMPLISFYKTCFICNIVSFSRCEFVNANITFASAFIKTKKLSFIRTQFGAGNLIFDNAFISASEINFFLADFGGNKKSFRSTNFYKGIINFTLAKFNDGEINFRFAKFINNEIKFIFTDFATSKVIFKSSVFVDCEIKFEDSKIEEAEIDFSKSVCKDTIRFTRNKLNKDINLNFAVINQLSINDCILKGLLFIKGEFEKLSFKDTINLGQIYMDWDKCNVKNAIINAYQDVEDDDEHKKSELIAKDFHLLSQNYKNTGEHSDEDKALSSYLKYQSKAVNLLSDGEGNRKFNIFTGFEKLYYAWFGNINELILQPSKLFALSLFLVLVFGLLNCFAILGHQYSINLSYFYFTDWTQVGLDLWYSLWDGLYFSGITFLTIGYGDIAPLNFAMKLFAFAEGFLGLMFVSFLSVATIRKLIR